MIEDRIIEVEIDAEGWLSIRPLNQNMPYIWRAAMGVHWDDATRTLYSPERHKWRPIYSPEPREMTYTMWFRQLVDAAHNEYGIRLSLSPETHWTNVPSEIRGEMERLPK